MTRNNHSPQKNQNLSTVVFFWRLVERLIKHLVEAVNDRTELHFNFPLKNTTVFSVGLALLSPALLKVNCAWVPA